MDIVQGVQPGNPPVGTTREWSDSNGLLYALLSTGANRKILESGQVAQSDLSPILDPYFGWLSADVALTPITVVVLLSFASIPDGRYEMRGSCSFANTAAAVGSVDLRVEDAAGNVWGCVGANIPASTTIGLSVGGITNALGSGTTTLRLTAYANGGTITAKSAGPVSGAIRGCTFSALRAV